MEIKINNRKGEFLKKVNSFFLTDVKIINKYLLIVITLILLSSVGYTSYALFSYETEQGSSIRIAYNPLPNLDESGANKPVIETGMIPVYYDETEDTWKKADSSNKDKNNKWYDYNNKIWANAVTVTEENRATYLSAKVGTPIDIDDINTMWVWIPRFIATGDTANYNGGTQDSPGAFDITFVSNDESAHDAFTFGTEELNGFWVGKFENSSDTTCTAATGSSVGSGCNLNTIRPKILPDQISWKGAQVSIYYADILNMNEENNQYGFDSDINTHMMKNSEWGAVAYLTQSIYGRCTSSTSCEEVSINNSSNYYTGRSGGTPGGSCSISTDGTYKYNENKIETSVVEETGINVDPTITNDSTYPWVNTDGVYSSSNNGQNSTTVNLIFAFTLSKTGTISFDYSVSSESGYDEMSYVINDGSTDIITGDVISGTTRGTEESSLSYDNQKYLLDAGTYTLTFSYVKDVSTSTGLDKGYVKNLVILDEVEIITKEVAGGQLASTTGNIYGVYDMSGGSWEYVMGVYTSSTQKWSGYDSTYHSGFSGCLGSSCSSTYTGISYPDSKYYNSYTTTSNYTSSNLQHTLVETNNWYGDYATFIDGDFPWLLRGGFYNNGTYSGIFYYTSYSGCTYADGTSRSVLVG